MNEEQEFDEIERFLTNRLEPLERIKFEERMNSDKTLKNNVEAYGKAIIEIKDQHFENSLRLHLESLIKIKPSKIKRNWVKYLFPIPVAAAIFILYLFNSPIYLPNTENDFSVTRGINTNELDLEDRFAFETFFDGQAHFVEGKYLLAIEDFKKALNTQNRPYFKEATKWHLALAYLKSEQPYEAEKVFNEFRKCSNCQYPVSFITKLKFWLRIQFKKI